MSKLMSQIDKWVCSSSVETRLKCAKRTDFTPTPEQVKRCLADNDPDVRSAWVERLRADSGSTLDVGQDDLHTEYTP